MLFFLVTVRSLIQFRYGSISGKANGEVKEGVVFCTYSALIGKSLSGGKFNTRLSQLEDWLGSDFDGVVSSCVCVLVCVCVSECVLQLSLYNHVRVLMLFCS